MDLYMRSGRQEILRGGLKARQARRTREQQRAAAEKELRTENPTVGKFGGSSASPLATAPLPLLPPRGAGAGLVRAARVLPPSPETSDDDDDDQPHAHVDDEELDEMIEAVSQRADATIEEIEQLLAGGVEDRSVRPFPLSLLMTTDEEEQGHFNPSLPPTSDEEESSATQLHAEPTLERKGEGEMEPESEPAATTISRRVGVNVGDRSGCCATPRGQVTRSHTLAKIHTRRVSVTFVQPGSLGLTLTQSTDCGPIFVEAISPSSQAHTFASHTKAPVLCGAELLQVSKVEVAGKSMTDVQTLLKARPINVVFKVAGISDTSSSSRLRAS
jgi:hypothetical protein